MISSMFRQLQRNGINNRWAYYMVRFSFLSRAFKEGTKIYGITVSSAIRRYLPTYDSSRYKNRVIVIIIIIIQALA